MIGAGGTLRSLRIRNLRLFLIGQALSQTGNWARRIALTLLVLDLTDDGVAVGVVTAAQFFPLLLLGVWAGVVVDRSDTRRVILISQIAATGQSVLLAALAFTGDPPVLALYVAALWGGLSFAFDNPARRAFVNEMVPPEDVTNAVGLNSAVNTCGRIVGPALTGLLIQTAGYGWCFVLDGFSYLAMIAALLLMDAGKLLPAPTTARARGQIREGLRYARSVRELRVSLVMVALVGTLALNFQVVLPILVRRSYEGSDLEFTLLYSATSVGALVGALRGAQRRSADLLPIVRDSTAFGVAMSLLAAAPAMSMAYPCAFLLGAASTLFVTGITSLLQLRARPSMRGRVLAFESVLVLGSTPVGALIVGAVSEAFGARTGMLVGSAACFAAAAYGFPSAANRTTRRTTGGTMSPRWLGQAAQETGFDDKVSDI